MQYTIEVQTSTKTVTVMCKNLEQVIYAHLLNAIDFLSYGDVRNSAFLKEGNTVVFIVLYACINSCIHRYSRTCSRAGL